MATNGGDHRRLFLPQKKVWRQVVPRISNTEQQQATEMVKNMSSLDMNTRSYNIPNDIIIEILSWVAANSLLRLRWACKYWFDLITRDDDFIKMQFHRSTTIDHDIFSSINHSVLSANVIHRNKIFQCYLSYKCATRVGGVDVSSEVSIVDLPFHYPLGYHPEILGSCNGLILLYERSSENLCIWNPCTKEYRILPHPLYIQGENSDNRYSRGYNYGFCYDHTIDDYKVIRNTNGWSYDHNDYKVTSKIVCHETVRFTHYSGLLSGVQVYTLGTNSWRRIAPNPYRLPTRQLTQGVFMNRLRNSQLTQGMFMNGVLYWMDSLDENIISFDLGKEEFRRVSQRPNLCHVYCAYVKIQVFEGSLCLVLMITNQQKGYRLEIWEMKHYAECNENESLWTKLSTILFPLPFQIDLLRYTKNGEILMLKDESDLLLYDQKNRNVKTLDRIFEYSNNHFVQEVYTESLVSLNSGTYTGREERKNHNKKMG